MRRFLYPEIARATTCSRRDQEKRLEGRALRGKKVLAWLLTSASIVSGAPAVRAEATPAQREQARQLAAEGFEALQRHDYGLAEDRFRRADALVHAPTLVVDHARALTGLGRLVEAHERYELVLREGLAPGAPWQWRLAHADATRELEALKPRLAWLTLRVKGPGEPRVLVDNKLVPVAALGVRRATDPGTHSVSVSAAGFDPKEEIVTLDEGQTVALEIELTARPRAARTRTADSMRKSPEAPVVADPLAPPPPQDKTLAYVLLGLGGLGITAGAVTGGLAFGARSDLSSNCPKGVCRPKSPSERDAYQRDIDQYHLWGTLSGIGFSVGFAAAGTAVAILLLGGGSESQKAAGKSERVEAYVGVGSIGIKSRF
jgi:hypothetical protein